MRTAPISHGDFDALKRYAVFDLPADECASLEDKNTTSFVNPASVDAFQRIAAALRTRGYDVSKVGPGSVGIWCRCRLGSSGEVWLSLFAQRKKKHYVRFDLATYWSAPFLHRVFDRAKVEIPDSDCAEKWMRLCGAIHDVIVNTLEAPSVAWLTEDEANVLESSERAES